MTGPHSIQQQARVMASAEQALRSQDSREFLARNAQAIWDIRAERLAREAMEKRK